MYRQDEGEVVPIWIRLNDRHRRTVLLNGSQDGGIAGVARLGKFQFLQEIPDTTVSVLLGKKTESLKVSLLDRPVRPRNTVDLHFLARERDNDRLRLTIGLVVHRVDQRLFDGNVGIVPVPLRLRAVGYLEHLLLKHVVLDERQCLAQLYVQRPLEILLHHALTRRIRLVHNLNPRIAKEVLRMRIEEQQPHVGGLTPSSGPRTIRRLLPSSKGDMSSAAG